MKAIFVLRVHAYFNPHTPCPPLLPLTHSQHCIHTSTIPLMMTSFRRVGFSRGMSYKNTHTYNNKRIWISMIRLKLATRKELTRPTLFSLTNKKICASIWTKQTTSLVTTTWGRIVQEVLTSCMVSISVVSVGGTMVTNFACGFLLL